MWATQPEAASILQLPFMMRAPAAGPVGETRVWPTRSSEKKRKTRPAKPRPRLGFRLALTQQRGLPRASDGPPGRGWRVPRDLRPRPSPSQAHSTVATSSQPGARRPICSIFTLEETQSLLDAPRINGSGRYERRCRSISATLPLCANGRNKHHERHEAPTTLQHYKECNAIQRSHEQIAPYTPINFITPVAAIATNCSNKARQSARGVRTS